MRSVKAGLRRAKQVKHVEEVEMGEQEEQEALVAKLVEEEEEMGAGLEGVLLLGKVVNFFGLSVRHCCRF